MALSCCYESIERGGLEFHWQETRERAITLFDGQMPRDDQEETVIKAWQKRPQLVEQEIAKVGMAVQSGKVSYGWAVLRANVVKMIDEGKALSVTDTSSRDGRIRQARIWIANAGGGFDRQAELEDELFGHFGMLREWRNDVELRAEIVHLWKRMAPRFAAVDADNELFYRDLREAKRKMASMTPEEKRAHVQRVRQDLADRGSYVPQPEGAAVQRQADVLQTTFDGDIR